MHGALPNKLKQNN